ncbi:MAG: 6-bladed beta-propeller [Dehalococcoidia bacterium]|nr:6-bladed beta-propeller [Dehalococcoidia bacterium]
MRLFRRPLASHVAAVRVSAAAALIATSLLFIPMHHPAPLLADEEPPVFVELWGVENSEGSALGEFDDLSGISVGADGKVYVADTDNNRIQIFSSDGTSLDQWTGFNKPEGVAVDSAGNVYVADTDNHRVAVLSSTETVLHVLDGHDAGSDNFQYPSGIAVAPDGNTLYIADTYNHCVHIYTLAEGTYGHTETIGDYEIPGTGNGQFNNPYGVAVGPDGSVYVADTSNRRIQKFDADGGYVTQWGEYGQAAGQFWDPAGVAVDSEGNVWVADTGNGRIQKFTASGVFIMTFGQGGSGPYHFSGPDDLAVMSDGTILVEDSGNHCIKVYRPASFYAAPPVLLSTWGSSGTCGDGDLCNPISIAIDEDGYVFVGNQNNRRVQKFTGSGGFIAT